MSQWYDTCAIEWWRLQPPWPPDPGIQTSAHEWWGLDPRPHPPRVVLPRLLPGRWWNLSTDKGRPKNEAKKSTDKIEAQDLSVSWHWHWPCKNMCFPRPSTSYVGPCCCYESVPQCLLRLQSSGQWICGSKMTSHDFGSAWVASHIQYHLSSCVAVWVFLQIQLNHRNTQKHVIWSLLQAMII